MDILRTFRCAKVVPRIFGPAGVACPGEEEFAAPLIWYGKLNTAKVTTPL
jgi:hypothetical protein